MTDTHSHSDSAYRLALISEDSELIDSMSAAFRGSRAFDLEVINEQPAQAVTALPNLEPRVVILDLGSGSTDDRTTLQACAATLGANTPVIVVANQCDAALVRCMMQLKIADFLTKPVSAEDFIRTCLNVLETPVDKGRVDAEIRTFIPAAGGVGVTTLALQAAGILRKGGAKDGKGTCIVDLNFQHGSCADYLDIDPQFDAEEIENSPERLDQQLLEVMLSTHSSGIHVIAAPHQPSELRSFNPEVVIRLLDLVSGHFENVVIDMPRIWFPWTETVLLGSNKLYVVSDMTVPCIRNAERLVQAIRRQVGEQSDLGVIVNRYEEHMFDGGLKRTDLEEVLKGAFLGGVPNNYKLVREAIDKGAPLDEIKPKSNISVELEKILFRDEIASAPPKKSILGFLSNKSKKAA